MCTPLFGFIRDSRSDPLTEDSLLFDGPRAAYGRFRILHQIGAGSVGPVFRGEDSETRRRVVVKVIRVGLTPERVAVVGPALRALMDQLPVHQSLSPVLEAGVVDVEPFVVSPVVEGDSLDVALRDYGPANLVDALPRLRALAEALDALGAAGLAHGSLHPRDVIVSVENTVITGCGIAAVLERVGVRPPVRRPYCAPEVALGGKTSAAADQFALAAITHELLSGRRVVVGEAPRVPAASAEAAEVLATVFGRALAADPADRFESAAAFVEALAAVPGGVSGRSRAPRRKPEVAAPLLEFDSAEELRAEPGREEQDAVVSASSVGEQSLEAFPVEGEPPTERVTSRRPLETPVPPSTVSLTDFDAPVSVPAAIIASEPVPVAETPIPVELTPAPSPRTAPIEPAVPVVVLNAVEAAHDQPPAKSASGQLSVETLQTPVLPDPVAPPDSDVLELPVDLRATAFDSAAADVRLASEPSTADLDAVAAVEDEPEDVVPERSVLPFQVPEGLAEVPVQVQAPEEPKGRLALLTLAGVIALGTAILLFAGQYALRSMTPSLSTTAAAPTTTAAAPSAPAVSPTAPPASPAPAPPTPAPAERNEGSRETPRDAGTAPAAGSAAAATPPAVVAPAAAAPAPAAPSSSPASALAPASAPPAPAVATAAPAPSGSTRGAGVAPGQPGRLLVRSTPAGAEVFVNGQRRGVAPITIRGLSLGAYSVRLTRRGYEASEQRVTLEAARPARSVDVRLTRTGSRARAAAERSRASATAAGASASARTATLVFESRPSGARVFLDGTAVGVTPATVQVLSAGQHAVRFELGGYLPINTSTRVELGARTRVAVTLTSQRPQP